MRVQRWLWLKSLSESRQCLPQDSHSAISWKDGFVLFSNLRLGRQLKRHEKLHNSRKRLFPATKSNIDWMSAEMWEREGDATTARTNSYRRFRVRCFCLTPKYWRIPSIFSPSCSQKNPQFFDAVWCDSVDYVAMLLQLSIYSVE